MLLITRFSRSTRGPSSWSAAVSKNCSAFVAEGRIGGAFPVERGDASEGGSVGDVVESSGPGAVGDASHA